MIHPFRTRLALFIVSILISVAAYAGLTATEKSAGWRIGTETTKYNTVAECIAATKLRGPGTYPCNYSTLITVVATCDDVPMPVMPTIVNADGSIERPGIKGEVRDEGAGKVLVITLEEGFVPGTFPNCWVPGWVPYDGKFRAPDGPPSTAPSPWVYTVDPEWPIGGKCPAQKDGKNDPSLCYSPPNPPIPPAP